MPQAGRPEGSGKGLTVLKGPFRVTPEESKQIDALAAEAGQKLSEYLRHRALQKPRVTAARVDRLTLEAWGAELASRTADLGRIGANLNQLAKAFNQEARFGLTAEDVQTFHQLLGVLESVRDLQRRIVAEAASAYYSS